MDNLPLRGILISFVSVALVWLWAYFAWRRRRGQDKTPMSEVASERAPLTWQRYQGWIAAVVVVGLVAILVSYYSPLTSSYLSRHPPIVEHRRELIETASKQLRCPPEQLVIKPSGDSGAQVQGCGGVIGLCWGAIVAHRAWGWSVSRCYAP